MGIIEWLRQYRIGEFAIFDLALAFGGMFLAAPVLSRWCEKAGFRVPRRNWIILTLPLSVLVHGIVGSPTAMTTQFLDPHGHYVLKILIVGLTVVGFVGIQKNPRQEIVHR